MLSLSDQRDPESGRCLLQDSLGCIASAQNDFESSCSRYVRHDSSAKSVRKFVQTIQVGRVCHRNVQTLSVTFERKKLVAHHQIDGNLVKQIIVDGRLLVSRKQINKLQAITTREFLCRPHLRWLVILFNSW